VQEQFGLRLDPAKGPGTFLIIDGVARRLRIDADRRREVKAGGTTAREKTSDYACRILKSSTKLVDKVGELIREGNVRRIIVKDEKGNTFVEIPLTVATVGVVAAPVLAALGTIAALIAHVTVVVEKVEPHASAPPSQEPPTGNGQ
jgi:hypothetical protein